MDQCVECNKPTDMVCQCEFVSLCYNCLTPHSLASPDVTHMFYPYARKEQKRPDYDKIISTIQKQKYMDHYITTESEHLAKAKQYRTNLPGVFDKLVSDIKSQVDSLYRLLNEILLEIEQKIERNLQICHTGDFNEENMPQVTEGIDFDIETSLEPLIDEFVVKVQNRLSVTHRMQEALRPRPQEQLVREEPQEYCWSKNLRSQYIEIEEDGKTIKGKNGVYGTVLVDKPMSTDKHVWKIKIENMGYNSDLVGVSDLINEFNTPLFSKQNFKCYSYRYGMVQKINNDGTSSAYGKNCQVGDIITITLEFNNGKGVLSFAVNGEDQGVAFRDLTGPLYPMAQLNHGISRISIID